MRNINLRRLFRQVVGLAMWSIIRYSRQYSGAKMIWSLTTIFGGLPAINQYLADLSRTKAHILSNAPYGALLYSLKSVAESCFSRNKGKG
jgi:hypothetical protein